MNRLRELREAAVLTLHELAEKSGVSDDTINKIELGHRIGRPSTLRKLARALDTTPQDLKGPPKAGSGAVDTRTGDERLHDRLAPRVERLERLDLAELSERRRELQEQLANLKEKVEYKGGHLWEVTDFPTYLEIADELLAIMSVLERSAGRAELQQ